VTDVLFKLEEEMRKPVEKWLVSEGHMVRREFQTSAGVCDLVGCTIDPGKAQHRLELGQSRQLGSLFRVNVWCRLPEAGSGESASSASLFDFFRGHISEREIEHQLNALRRKGFVEKTQSGGYQKVNGWEPLQRSIVAVEMKLRDVRGALAQAERYSLFTDLTFVALPAPKAYRVLSRDREVFRSVGVGLLAVEAEGVETLLHARAQQSEPTTAARIAKIHAVERFWPQYLSDAVQH